MNETQKQVAAVLMHSVANRTATPEQVDQLREYLGIPKMNEAPASKGSFYDLCVQLNLFLHWVKPGWDSSLKPDEQTITGDAIVLAMCSTLRQLNACPQIADVYHAGTESYYKAFLLQKLTPEDVHGFDEFMDSDAPASKPCPTPSHPDAVDVALDDEEPPEDDESDDVPRPRKTAGKAKFKRKTAPAPDTPTDSIALVLEAWDHGQFAVDFIKRYGFFPPVRKALDDLLTWLTYDHTKLKYLPPDSMAKKVEPMSEPKLNRLNEALAKFYNVESDQALIEAQAKQVEKLQTRLYMAEKPPALPRRPRGF